VEVALPRSHLVNASGIELVETHDGVRFEGSAVQVPGRVRGSSLPLFYHDVMTTWIEWRVGAPLRRLRVDIAEQLLGGNREGGEPIRAQKEKHHVGDRFQREVGQVYQGGSDLNPLQG